MNYLDLLDGNLIGILTLYIKPQNLSIILDIIKVKVPSYILKKYIGTYFDKEYLELFDNQDITITSIIDYYNIYIKVGEFIDNVYFKELEIIIDNQDETDNEISNEIIKSNDFNDLINSLKLSISKNYKTNIKGYTSNSVKNRNFNKELWKPRLKKYSYIYVKNEDYSSFYDIEIAANKHDYNEDCGVEYEYLVNITINKNMGKYINSTDIKLVLILLVRLGLKL